MANFANLAFGLIRTPPSPTTSGVTLDLEPGHGARLPPVPFEATIWPVTVMPDPTTAEIVTVTEVLIDTLTITRAQQGTIARAIVPGDQLAGTITKAYLDTVPLVTDPSVTFQGTLTSAGQLTATGLLVGLAGAHVFGATTLDGPTTVTGDLTVGGLVVSPELRGYSETVQAAAVASGTIAIDYALGNHVIVALSENVTGITISHVPPYGKVAPVMFYYVASGGTLTVVHTINGHPVRFSEQTPPILSTIAGYIDRVLYTTWDGGTVWLADIIGRNY